VATPSLYKHVGGLADLRDRVSVRVMGELAEKVRRSVVGVSGDAAIVALLRAYRDYLVEYPHRAAVSPCCRPVAASATRRTSPRRYT